MRSDCQDQRRRTKYPGFTSIHTVLASKKKKFGRSLAAKNQKKETEAAKADQNRHVSDTHMEGKRHRDIEYDRYTRMPCAAR